MISTSAAHDNHLCVYPVIETGLTRKIGALVWMRTVELVVHDEKERREEDGAKARMCEGKERKGGGMDARNKPSTAKASLQS